MRASTWCSPRATRFAPRPSSSSASGPTAAGADIIQQQAGADPGAVVFDAVQAARSRRADVVIIDTAGRLHSQSHLMDELKKVKRVIQRVEPSAPHEVLLVLDANQGQNALTQATQFHEAVGVTGLVLTKLDGTAKGGIVIAIARKLGIPDSLHRRRRTGRGFRRIRRARLCQRAGFRQSAWPQAKTRRHDLLRQRREALPEWPRGARGRDVHDPARRVRVPHRPLRRGQEQRAQAHRAARTSQPRHGHRERPEHRQAQGRQDSGVPPRHRRGVPGSQAAGRPARSTTTWRCRWWWPARRSRKSTGACAPRSTRSGC